jgi:signal transduction histidine kinase
VRQILINLLSNAIKFGNGKPIQVTCTGLDDGSVRIDVEDHGVGIAPEDIPKIFDEFVQLQKTHNEQGTGLGLPISNRLATLLNGRLECRSVPGEGSTFTLTLPPNVDTGAPSSQSAERSEPTLRADRPVSAPVYREGPRSRA